MSRPGRTAGVLLAVALATAGAAVAAPRIHRTTLPPPVALPSSLSVDEDEWNVVPSKRIVAAGAVKLQIYNRGMDDHDLTLVDGTGQTLKVDLAPGASGELTAQLTPGRYKLYCSILAGTPASHETLGMVEYIDAQSAPTAATLSKHRTKTRR
jgi:hypothetical protein